MFYVIEGAIEAKEGAAQMSNTLGGFDHTKCTNQPGSTCGFMEAAGIPVLCGEVAGECAVPTSSHRTQWRDLGICTPGCGHGPSLRSHGTEDGGQGVGVQGCSCGMEKLRCLGV